MNWFQRQQALGRGFRRHSPEITQLVVDRVAAGESKNSVAKDLGINESTVRSMVARNALQTEEDSA